MIEDKLDCEFADQKSQGLIYCEKPGCCEHAIYGSHQKYCRKPNYQQPHNIKISSDNCVLTEHLIEKEHRRQRYMERTK